MPENNESPEKLTITREMIIAHFDNDPRPMQIDDLAAAIIRAQGIELPEGSPGYVREAAKQVCRYSAYLKIHNDMRQSIGNTGPETLVKDSARGWYGKGHGERPQHSWTLSKYNLANDRVKELVRAEEEQERVEQRRAKAKALALEELAGVHATEFAAIFERHLQELTPSAT